jgi:hypothetical protein
MGREQVLIEQAQFLTEPEAGKQGLFDVKPIGKCGIEMQVKSQFDDEQRMLEQRCCRTMKKVAASLARLRRLKDH